MWPGAVHRARVAAGAVRALRAAGRTRRAAAARDSLRQAIDVRERLLARIAEIAAARVASTGADPDRFEREQRDFFVRVREAYLERARMAPQRIRVLDANRAPELIRADIERIVAALVGA